MRPSFPIRMIGVRPRRRGAGAARLRGSQRASTDLMSFDMGGTTAKPCLIEDGRRSSRTSSRSTPLTASSAARGLPVKTPVDRHDRDRRRRRSHRARRHARPAQGAGRTAQAPTPARPATAAAGRSPTVTDADLVLGYLDPGFFLGGEMRLDAEAASDGDPRARRRTARPRPWRRRAWGIHRLVNEDMASAARVHAAERGDDATAAARCSPSAGPGRCTRSVSARRSEPRP